MEILLRCKIIQEKKLCIIPAHDHDNKYKFKKRKNSYIKKSKKSEPKRIQPSQSELKRAENAIQSLGVFLEKGI